MKRVAFEAASPVPVLARPGGTSTTVFVRGALKVRLTSEPSDLHAVGRLTRGYFELLDSDVPALEVTCVSSDDVVPSIASRNGRCIITGAPGALRVQACLRAVRGLLRRQAFANGALLLHGALLDLEGRGIGYLGGKYSGKTSSLLAGLTTPGASMVTNDDLTVLAAGPRHTAWGWPRSIGVRRNTFEVFRHWLGPTLASLTHPDNASGSSVAAGDVFFTPYELAAAFGGVPKPDSTLSLLVFPRFSEGTTRAVVRPLARREAHDLLTQAVELLADPHLPQLEDLFTPADPGLIARAVESVANSVPAIALTQGLATLEEGAILVREALGAYT